VSASITRRHILAILGALALAGCGPPRAMDTGDPLISPDREIHYLLWERDIGRALEFPATGVDGTWLVAPTGGKLMRLNGETGEAIWKTKIPATPTAPVVICGDVVVVATDSPSGEIMGADLQTGEELWRWGRALALPVGVDSLLVLAARGGRLIRLDPLTGEEVWEVMQEGAGWSPPIILRERDLVVVPIRPDSVIARRLDDGSRVWAAQVGSWPTAGGDDSHLIVATDDSSLVSLDPGTGETGARIPLGAMPAGPPVVSGDTVFVAVRSGVLFALDPGELHLIWKQNLDPPLVAGPLLHDGMVLQTAPRGHVVGLDSRTGEIVGVLNHPEIVVSMPMIEGQSLAVGGTKGTLAVYRRDP
jgi:outer membrane protein assembly factor BamB